MKINILPIIILVWAFLASCTQTSPKVRVTIDAAHTTHPAYLGNGVQWDPYQLDYGHGRMEISEADWQKLYKRLDFMRPQFIRVMINTTSCIQDGKLVPEKNLGSLTPILDYCQQRNITVLFGDWGGGLVHSQEKKINEKNIQAAAQYVAFLIQQKGYTCIRYYNLVNEPNGYWSSTDGNYSLWANAIRYFYNELEKHRLTGILSIVGPDAAIWKTTETWWVDSCATHLEQQIGLYDIHTYPSKTTVNSGEYAHLIQAYKEKVPQGKKIIMGEIGFKFVEAADSLYQQENLRRVKSKPYASLEDSQMFVYDYMYGTDMADALFQTVNAGFSGSIAWMLDDAMHANEAPDKLKVWGFWNILGEEYFGPQEENIRPWYYAWSLLCRYMPAGCHICPVDVNSDNAVKAVAVEKDGKYMLALVNVSKEPKNVFLSSSTLPSLHQVKEYVYAEGKLLKEDDCRLAPTRKGLTLSLQKGETIPLAEETLLVYTNFKY